ncbi:hypothetical protein [Salmonella phage NINP13076]|uniref:Uncharacterized protein n=1 Tax=Salmonella phage SalP219 TaxID=3158864 RepID=A0AAU7PJJ2_9CAUD|nr:hypothetical protein [Salmonella phage NINP13076]
MSREKTKWRDRGFDDKHHYAGWLYFNDLTDDSKMYDDVYYDQYSGKIINVAAPSNETSQDEEEDEADKYLAQFEEK